MKPSTFTYKCLSCGATWILPEPAPEAKCLNCKQSPVRVPNPTEKKA